MYEFFKRLLDILLAGTVFIIFLPFFIPIVILLKVTGEGEIFYLQKRIGYKNKPFNIMKFATMLKNSPNMVGGSITLRKDPRITPMGGFLRRSKLNEIPQIINVLKGDMSIVGPRPLMKVSTMMYTDEVRAKVYDSKPGITGIGSLVFRDEELLVTNAKERGEEPRRFYETAIYPYKGKLEMWYRGHKSMYTDIMIIFLTAWNILYSKSHLVFKIFKDLPERPSFLK